MATLTQAMQIRRADTLHRRRGVPVRYLPGGVVGDAIETFAFFAEPEHGREGRTDARTTGHRVHASVPKAQVAAVLTGRDTMEVPGEVVGDAAELVVLRVGRVVEGREGGGSWVVALSR